jgi:hypothetical protein
MSRPSIKKLFAEIVQNNPGVGIAKLNEIAEAKLLQRHNDLLAARTAAQGRSKVQDSTLRTLRERIILGLMASGYKRHSAEQETDSKDKLEAAARKMGIELD